MLEWPGTDGMRRDDESRDYVADTHEEYQDLLRERESQQFKFYKFPRPHHESDHRHLQLP
jgi:hypothetical protein